jgi:hypothetical protein
VPPDDPAYTRPSTSTTAHPSGSRVWFSAASRTQPETSYQSGGIPTFDSSQSGGLGAAEDAESQQNQWESSLGFRVDVMAAVAYLFGPLSGEILSIYLSDIFPNLSLRVAFLVLILETKNDYVRFHGVCILPLT